MEVTRLLKIIYGLFTNSLLLTCFQITFNWIIFQIDIVITKILLDKLINYSTGK